MDDSYGAKLWDILPQEDSIAGIGHDDTIILDGCYAANVRWKSFARIAYEKRDSWKRVLARRMLRLSGATFWLSLVMLLFIPIIGIPLLMYSLIWILLSPWLLHVIYLGKFWGSQGAFFAFEGYMDLPTIEKQLFGARLGRMKWTPYSSPLSRHHCNGHGDCVPDDPTSDPKVAAMVEKARHAKPGDQRIFTLIDTGKLQSTSTSHSRISN